MPVLEIKHDKKRVVLRSNLLCICLPYRGIVVADVRSDGCISRMIVSGAMALCCAVESRNPSPVGSGVSRHLKMRRGELDSVAKYSLGC